jgi:lipoprotein-anchoring transpeptidase ErfK/SrfK
MQPRYYRSTVPRLTQPADSLKTHKRHIFRNLLIIVVLLAIGFGGYHTIGGSSKNTKSVASVAKTTAPTSKSPVTATTKQAAKTPVTNVASTVNHCAGNALSQNAIVSISARHMWACDATKQIYDSPVVTGIEYLAADTTPTGTYHIYAKETDLTLTGSDSTGSWSDPVSYWMPFLYNQYGAYGFHDATWRAPSAFGNIDPNSADASHGCVELPLATAQWVYGWASVGTTVTIES